MQNLYHLTVLSLFFATVSSMKCPPGTYRGFISGCTPCPKGTFNPFSGAPDEDVCRPCPLNTFQPNTGATDCKPCPSGTKAYRGYTKCFTCGPGTALNRRQQGCVKCDKGFYQNMTVGTSCDPCPDGTSSRRGARSISECFLCPPGSYGYGQGCDLCRRGYFKPGREGDCERCPPGSTSSEGAIKCRSCPAGTFSTYGTVRRFFAYTCEKCPPGTISQKASDICRKEGAPCPPRHFENRLGGCQTCEIGFMFDPKNRKCVRCPPGSVSRGGMQTKCNVCPKGQVPDNPRSPRICRCARGFFFDSNGKCVGCPLGYDTYANPEPESFLGRRGCVPCMPGTFSNSPGRLCDTCPFPLAAVKEGSTSCQPCPFGTVPQFDRLAEAEACVTVKTGCPPGTINRRIFYAYCEVVRCTPNTPKSDIGKTCTPCEAGQFLEINGRGKPVCTSCPNDHFSEGGFAKCKKCPLGKLRNDIDGSKCSCNGVGPRRFQTIGGRGLIGGVCKACPPGTFSFANLYFPSTDESCTPCRPGTFAKKAGTEECIECPLNTFSSEKGSIRCKKCPKGTVGEPHFGATECIPQPV